MRAPPERRKRGPRESEDRLEASPADLSVEKKGRRRANRESAPAKLPRKSPVYLEAKGLLANYHDN